MDHQWEEKRDAGLPGYWFVKQNGLWGIWSEEKGLILSCRLDSVSPYQDGFAYVKGKHKSRAYFRLVDQDGLSPCWGLVNTDGQLLGQCFWEDDRNEFRGQMANGYFVNGYAVTKENDRYGYINHEGTIISPCIWDYSGSFDKDSHPAIVARRDGHYEEARGEWVNMQGWEDDWFNYYDDIPDWQIPLENPEIYCPRGYFFLTPDGSVLTPHGVVQPDKENPDASLGKGWLEVEPFSEGIARVRYEEHWEAILWDEHSNLWFLETERQYDEQSCLADGKLRNGYRLVKDQPDNCGNCYRILDECGYPVSPYRWSHVEEMFEPDNFPIRVYRRQWKNAESDGALDEDGSYYFPGNDPSFMQDATAGLSFHRGYYFLCADGAVITMSGCVKSEEEKELPDGWEWTEALFPFLPGENTSFPRACTIVNGHDITVALTGKFAIDENFGNDPCVEGSYNAIIPVNQEGLRHLMIRQGDRWGILHNRNEILTPCRWEEIRYTENHIYVRDNGLWGILDPVTGDLTEPCRLESIED